MGRRNPAAFSSGIANQQPLVPGIFDHDFLSRLNCQLPRRVVLPNCCFRAFLREELDRNPSCVSIQRFTPFPAEKFAVLTSKANPFSSRNLYRTFVLHPVFSSDASFARSFHVSSTAQVYKAPLADTRSSSQPRKLSRVQADRRCRERWTNTSASGVTRRATKKRRIPFAKARGGILRTLISSRVALPRSVPYFRLGGQPQLQRGLRPCRPFPFFHFSEARKCLILAGYISLPPSNPLAGKGIEHRCELAGCWSAVERFRRE